jgi:hypothetical protein
VDSIGPLDGKAGAAYRRWRRGTSAARAAEGYRVGNLKSSAETSAALHRVMLAHGVRPPTNLAPSSDRKSY